MEPTVPSAVKKDGSKLYLQPCSHYMKCLYTTHIKYWKILKCGAGKEWRKSVGQLRNEEALQRGKANVILLYTRQRRKAKWIGHILWRNCLLKQVMEEKVEGRTQAKEKGVTRYVQLMDDLKEMKGCKKLNQEAHDHILWITCFERGYGPVTRHTTE